ncbi:hypothetical protein [Streptomyces sp. NPDC058964]|uniref:hypothetical protein n=1 Tax=Streptomyces sp. NPDC058964 TaxID=3346681 RepID=UPI0036826E8F
MKAAHLHSWLNPLTSSDRVYRVKRSGRQHLLHVGAIEGCSCKVLGIDRDRGDRGDHSMRHRGEREPGQTVMRGTIPPYDFDDEDE